MSNTTGILGRRRAGVLLHITSLPSGLGNGDLGSDAFRFVDFLSSVGLSVWQTLPINPTHADRSPYQCLSVHAGNPLLIDLGWLVRKGWLPSTKAYPERSAEEPAAYRLGCLRQAFQTFRSVGIGDADRAACAEFVESNRWWLDDYALYMAIREECCNKPWQAWPVSLRDRWPAALRAARLRLAETIARVQFEQYVFQAQWQELRDYARQRGIILFGDMPIFVACDSADVWAYREYFDLNEAGHARVVAGVPPDYFSATGQRWGNPHYDWPRMENDGFRWWMGRLRSQLALYDWIRIDHFRGFEAYWEIPAESETAIAGRWIKAPGERLLETAFRSFAGESLPLVAEDLGIITPEVEALRDHFGIPGMKILQFAFDGGPGNPYLTHNHPLNSVVYTGTHDNDTTLAWFESLSLQQQRQVFDYLDCSEAPPMPWALTRSAMSSVARLTIVPMQDILELGKGHRMNTPGTLGNNWCWRFAWEQLTDAKLTRIAKLIRLYGRHPRD